MFGEHPYSVTAPTPESIDATTRERLVEFHRSKFVANNAVFVVVGDVKQDAILERIETLFADWQQGPVSGDEFPPPLHDRLVPHTLLTDQAQRRRTLSLPTWESREPAPIISLCS